MFNYIFWFQLAQNSTMTDINGVVFNRYPFSLFHFFALKFIVINNMIKKN